VAAPVFSVSGGETRYRRNCMLAAAREIAMGEGAVPTQIEAPATPARTFDDAAAGPRLDLLGPPAKPRCPEGAPGEIVVCARNDEQYRLRPLPEKFARKGEGDAQVDLGDGVAVAVEAERAGVGGVISNRAMVRLKLKF
jgi:hypothetical protein